MNWKKGSILGIISAVFSSLASIIYNKIYSEAFAIDFSTIINIVNIIYSNVIACLLMAFVYTVLISWKGNKLVPWANILFSVVSFASIVSVFAMRLPLDMESPEMFPGLAIPMHFFPVLSFLTLCPFFKLNQ